MPTSIKVPVSEFEGERILTAVGVLEGKLLGRIGEISESQEKLEGSQEKLEERVRGVETAIQSALVTNQALGQLREELKETNTKLGANASHMMAVLQRDVVQESRIGSLELKAELAGSEAGKTAGKDSGAKAAIAPGAIASVLASALFYLIQQLMSVTSPVIHTAPNVPAPMTTTALPSGR